MLSGGCEKSRQLKAGECSSNLPPIADHAAILYVPDGMTREQSKGFLDCAHRECCLRPSHVVRRRRRTSSWYEFIGQARGALAIVGL
jgi:hypothetical protein